MKKLALSLVLLMFIFANSLAQITFQSGYFINNTGERITCFIKNYDWKNNPTDIQYKLDSVGETSKKYLNQISEFGINGILKYKRFSVLVDKSSNDINNLSLDRNPIFHNDTVLLKTLVEGKATLYKYSDGNLVRYFFSFNNNEPTQLIYKKYLNEAVVLQNDYFKQQLLNTLVCDEVSSADVNNLSYYENDLIKLFVKYNQCAKVAFVNFNDRKAKNPLKGTLKLGVGLANLFINDFQNTSNNINFQNTLNFRLGFAFEVALPFHNKKWSLVFEPTFQAYKREKTIPPSIANVVAEKVAVNVNYQSLEFPIGLRHYFFLNKDEKLFVNAFYFYEAGLNSSLTYKATNPTWTISSIKLRPTGDLVYGFGYKHKDKLSIELRHYTNRTVMNSVSFDWDTRYRTTAILLGWQLF